jgi:hypothetical protein
MALVHTTSRVQVTVRGVPGRSWRYHAECSYVGSMSSLLQHLTRRRFARTMARATLRYSEVAGHSSVPSRGERWTSHGILRRVIVVRGMTEATDVTETVWENSGHSSFVQRDYHRTCTGKMTQFIHNALSPWHHCFELRLPWTCPGQAEAAGTPQVPRWQPVQYLQERS